MVNLLPTVAHRRAVREYRRRLLSVWLFSSATIFGIGSGLLLPAYFFAGVARTTALQETVQAAQNQTPGTAAAAAQEKFSAALFEALTQEVASPLASDALKAVVGAQTSGVSIQG